MSELFRKFARKISEVLAGPSLPGGVVLIVIWAVLGPIYHYRHLAARHQHRHHHRDLLMVFSFRTRRTGRQGDSAQLDELIRGVQGHGRAGAAGGAVDEELKELGAASSGFAHA